MNFVKKHYEKILLSLVLLGLGAAAVWLPFAIQGAKKDLADMEGPVTQARALAMLDLTNEKAVLDRLKNPPAVVLSGGHNLFNPVTWKKSGLSTLIKILVEGPDALIVKNIRPLFLTIALDRVAGSGYWLSTQQHSKKGGTVYAKQNEKATVTLSDRTTKLELILRTVKGPPEDPTELDVELLESQEIVPITKTQPFQRVDGQAADLSYPPENQTFSNKLINQILPFAGDAYKIVYITNNAVRVSANSTTKQTTIIWNGTP